MARLFCQGNLCYFRFYHGVIFSIIFKKPFSAFVRDSKSNNIGNILRELNAEERILSPLQMSLDLKDLEGRI